MGETFDATAVHQLEECVQNLIWTTTGSVTLQEAQGSSATFTADEVGSGRITVRNREGDTAVAEIDVLAANRPPSS